MNCRDRENATLGFKKDLDRGAVQETFYPWTLTVDRWAQEGLPIEQLNQFDRQSSNNDYAYLSSRSTEWYYHFEKFFGFDGVKRITVWYPFVYEEKLLEKHDDHEVWQDTRGYIVKRVKGSELEHVIKPLVTCEEDWEQVKERAKQEIEKYYTDEAIVKEFSHLKAGHEAGEYSIRLNIPGFFWTPRDLMDIEPHMYAFYDYPELLHDINTFMLELYLDKVIKVLKLIPADVVYIMEDLSGANGPMLSKDHFDEFVGAYYKRLIPKLKECGVKHIIVDTDGDFTNLIPNFLEAGVEGFLPLDVNAGVDIVEVRKQYPHLKLIGGFNKLCIAAGKEAIDKEFERIMPVIRQGGYLPGTDHQVAPSTSMQDYLYFVKRLTACMKETGNEL